MESTCLHLQSVSGVHLSIHLKSMKPVIMAYVQWCAGINQSATVYILYVCAYIPMYKQRQDGDA